MKINSSITDSPWFWMLIYSTVPLIGLALLSQKYAERQSRLERQYQGHLAAAEQKSQKLSREDTVSKPDSSSTPEDDSSPDSRQYSSPEDTIIPLAPLTLIFLAIACFAAVMLAREHRRRTGTQNSATASTKDPEP